MIYLKNKICHLHLEVSLVAWPMELLLTHYIHTVLGKETNKIQWLNGRGAELQWLNDRCAELQLNG